MGSEVEKESAARLVSRTKRRSIMRPREREIFLGCSGRMDRFDALDKYQVCARLFTRHRESDVKASLPDETFIARFCGYRLNRIKY